MIEPVSDALTTVIRWFLRAKIPMISSGALPIDAFKSPPGVGPRKLPSVSVALPTTLDSGTIVIAAMANTSSGLASAK